jgi:hypothetical protein
MGYSAGRTDALGSGITGLLDEIARYKKALAAIGTRGKPLPAGLAKQLTRGALDRTGAREERRKRGRAHEKPSRQRAA